MSLYIHGVLDQMAAQNSRANDEKGTDIMKGEEKGSLIKAGKLI